MNLAAMTSRLVLVATLGLFGAFRAAASIIPIANFSFEAPVGFAACPGLGCSFSGGAIPGWTTGAGSGQSGEFHPGNPANTLYFNSITDGSTVGYSGGPTLFQTELSAPVQEGFLYTFMVDLGKRKDLPFTAGADLLINGHTIAASGTDPTSGNWSTFTASYFGLPADVGKFITIQLLSSGSQAEFDNVRLSVSATAVPEPAGASLLGLGLAGLLVFARRKRTS